MATSENFDLLNLYSKNRKEKFTEEELLFLKSKIKIEDFNVKYCIYRNISYKGIYFSVIIDSAPRGLRRSPIFNSWEVIDTRKLSEGEYEEVINNFGCNNRRFIVYQYKEINKLIADDLLYKVDTPAKYVNQCRNFVTPINVKN